MDWEGCHSRSLALALKSFFRRREVDLTATATDPRLLKGDGVVCFGRFVRDSPASSFRFLAQSRKNHGTSPLFPAGRMNEIFHLIWGRKRRSRL